MKPARLALLCAGAVLSACGGATAGRGLVIPYENGRFVATATARTEQDALRDALGAAKDECGGRRQPLAVIKQKTEYKGVVAREIVKTAEQIEEIIAAGGGKVIPDLSSDEDYKVSIEFRCQQ
jgi:hypothetical protein